MLQINEFVATGVLPISALLSGDRIKKQFTSIKIYAFCFFYKILWVDVKDFVPTGISLFRLLFRGGDYFQYVLFL